jgi:hypothetical protein
MIWMPLAIGAGLIATGGLGAIGIPGLIGGGAAAAGGAGAAGAAGAASGGLSGATLATLAGAGISAGANIYGARRQGKATDRALDLERDNETRRRLEYDQMIAEQRRQFEAEQARRQPYREAAESTLRAIAASRGRPMPTVIPSTGKTLRTLGGGY